MLEMRKQARKASAFDEAGAQQLLEDDDAETGESGGERMMMKNRDAGERGGEKQKIDQYGEIVSAQLRSEANGHVQVLPVSVSIQEAGMVRLPLASSVIGTKLTICILHQLSDRATGDL